MDYTDEGRTRIAQIGGDGLVFAAKYMAVGTGGWDPGTPSLPLALVPSAVALTAEVARSEVFAKDISVDEMLLPRGKETVYTFVSGLAVEGVPLGEAGLFAQVTVPGTSGLAVGYTFLLAQTHFGRVHLPTGSKIAIQWPLDLYTPPAIYFGEGYEFAGAWEGTVSNVNPAPDFSAPSASFLEEYDVAWDFAPPDSMFYGATIGAVPLNLGTGGAWDTLTLLGVGDVVVDDAENVRFIATGSAPGSYANWNRAASAPVVPAEWAIGIRVKTQSGTTLDDYVAGNSGGIYIKNSRVPQFGDPVKVAAPGAITDDVWHTIVVGWDGTNAFIYVDGVTTTAVVANPGTLYPRAGEFGGPLGNFAPGTHYRQNRGAVAAYSNLADLLTWLEVEV
jgi:hypothetical protein